MLLGVLKRLDPPLSLLKQFCIYGLFIYKNITDVENLCRKLRHTRVSRSVYLYKRQGNTYLKTAPFLNCPISYLVTDLVVNIWIYLLIYVLSFLMLAKLFKTILICDGSWHEIRFEMDYNDFLCDKNYKIYFTEFSLSS